jgi:hypothetical protein
MLAFFVDNNFPIDINDYSIKKWGRADFSAEINLQKIEPSAFGPQGERHEASLD